MADDTQQLEKKFKAVARLQKDGRLDAFRTRQAFFRSAEGGKLDRTAAFYAALKEFPPAAELPKDDPDLEGL